MPLESFTRRVSAIPPGHLHEAKQIERLLRADRLFARGEMRLKEPFVRCPDAFANGAERLFHSRDTGQCENDLQFVGELRSPRLVFKPTDPCPAPVESLLRAIGGRCHRFF